jgi:outer membrane cobalamin receptor
MMALGQVEAQDRKGAILGLITNEQGEPLPGITVRLVDTFIGGISNAEGIYQLTKVPEGAYYIEASAVNYHKKWVEIKVVKDSTLLVEFTLNEKISELEEVVIQEKAEVTEIREQAYAVEVIGTKKFENRSIDINQLLTKSAGIRVRESGGLGSSFTYSINGMSGRAIKFFVDGIPIDRYGSGYSINNFPVNLIEHIEIYKGVLPASFGSDALGGAINIITKTGFENYVDASYSLGSFNTHRAALATHLTNPDHGLFLDFQGFYNYSDNNYEVWGPGVEVANPQTGRAEEIRTERFHDAYRSVSIKAEAGIRHRSWANQLKLGVLFADNFNELQHGATMAAVIGEAVRSEKSVAPSLQYHKAGFLTDRLDLNFFASYSYLTSVTTDTSSRIYNWRGEVIDERPNNSEMGGGRNGKSLLTLSTHNLFNQAALSYQLSPAQTLSLTHTLDDTKRSGSDPYISDRTASFKEPQEITKHITALAYQVKAIDDKWDNTLWVKNYDFGVSTVDEQYITDSLGYRPEAFPISDQLNSTGFGYATKYTFNPRHLVKLSAERAFRLPDPDEVLGDGLFVKNNPQLQPEESINLNASWLANRIPLGRESHLSFEPAFFYRYTRNLILYLVNEGRGIGTYTNIGKVRGIGGSLDLTYQYGDFLQLKANATYQDLRDWSKFQGPNRNQTFQDRLRNTPYLMANASINIQQENILDQGDQLSFYWDFQYVHEFFLNWPSLGAKSTKAVIPTQLIHSTGVGYSFHSGTYNLSLECTNLFDEQVYDNYLLQRPGRAYATKLRVFFNQLLTNN